MFSTVKLLGRVVLIGFHMLKARVGVQNCHGKDGQLAINDHLYIHNRFRFFHHAELLEKPVATVFGVIGN